MTAAKPNKKSAIEPTKVNRKVPCVPFTVSPLHKKALLKLLHCHHSGIALTYAELSLGIKVGEKTKAWQSGAWKDLKTKGFIVMGSEKKSIMGSAKSTFELSEKGVNLATCFASAEELEEFKAPISNDEHHEKIRKKLDKDVYKGDNAHKGKEIFNLLLKAGDDGITRLELASKMKMNPESSAFFYGFNSLKKMGLVSEVGKITKQEWLELRAEIMGNSEKVEKIAKIAAEHDGKVKKENIAETEESSKLDSDVNHDSNKKANGSSNKTSDVDLVRKTKNESDELDKTPKKTKKRSERVRGGLQLFKLSEKAYLTTP